MLTRLPRRVMKTAEKARPTCCFDAREFTSIDIIVSHSLSCFAIGSSRASFVASPLGVTCAHARDYRRRSLDRVPTDERQGSGGIRIGVFLG